MSEWQGYIDSSLIGSGAMHSAAIVGLADGSYWAYGGTHIPQPDEVQHILKALADPTIAQASGIRIAGEKYFTLRAEPGLLYIKLGAGGACIGKTMQTAVIGVYGEGVNPASCNAAVEGVVTYLKAASY